MYICILNTIYKLYFIQSIGLINLMKNNIKILQIRQLDNKLKGLNSVIPERPAFGWIKAMRLALSMTSSQLAKNLGISQQAAHAFEKGEVEETITLGKLRAVSAAMGFKLVYVFVPEETIEKLIEQKARDLATEIVMRASHQMAMENQKISEEKIIQAVKERTAEYIKTVPKNLWD